jgi:hypothetical protein
VINCLDVNQELCNTIFRYSSSYIDAIPGQYISREMITRASIDCPRVLIKANIPKEDMNVTVEKLIKSGDINLAGLQKDQLSGVSFQVFRDEIAKWPYFIKYVPDYMQTRVLESQDPEFYSTATLDEFSGVTIASNTFNKYFGHIPLYYITDIKGNTLKKFAVEMPGYNDQPFTCIYAVPENSVTWNPQKFAEVDTDHDVCTSWIPYYVYQAYFPENVEITINHDTSSISSPHKPKIMNRTRYVFDPEVQLY